jgi:hypothetical protein
MDDNRAGGSAQAEYARRLANHKAELRRRRSTILTVGAAFIIVGGFNAASGSSVGWLFVLLGITIPVVVLFTTPQSIGAWATGAEGEARTGRFLEPLRAEGFRILHDRRIPGSRANIDHIVIGPPGIFVVETMSYTGRVSIRGVDVFVAGRRKTAMIEEVRREALAVQIALADEIDANGYLITPIICIHRARLPWFGSEVGGIRLVSGKGLVKRLRKGDRVLGAEEVQRLADLAGARLKAAVQ